MYQGNVSYGHLLDAAPDMYEALRGILENAGYTTGQNSTNLPALRVAVARLDIARAAIAKADGS